MPGRAAPSDIDHHRISDLDRDADTSVTTEGIGGHDDPGGCAVVDWAASGGMALTGFRGAAPLISPAAAYRRMRGVVRALTRATGEVGDAVTIDTATAVFGRAAWSARERDGQRSVGGASRMLRAADGWCVVTLARADDVEAVPALLGEAVETDPWSALEARAPEWPADRLVERARLLGVPAAVVPSRGQLAAGRIGLPWKVSRISVADSGLCLRNRLVVDLSSLWAGPLCARVLGEAGAQVVKVESVHRPDGCRNGNPELFEWLHAGQEFRSVDFRSAAGRQELAELISAADIVIEASRPRALAQLGLAPDDLTHRPGRVWLSLTGYGRAQPLRVAFGDDVAAAGGLVAWSGDEPVFCGDAIADPLSGICAALAVVTAVRAGGGLLVDLSMQAIAAMFAAAPPVDHGPHRVVPHRAGWAVECETYGCTQPVLPPRAPASEERITLHPSDIRC